jgi:hypothetical protein
MALILTGITPVFAADDAKPTASDYLSLCSIVPDDSFNRQFGTPFEYENVFAGEGAAKVVRGLYRRDRQVLTMEHVADVKMETREIDAAPIEGIRFLLNESGTREMRAYLSKGGAQDLVVIIDGHPYATVSLDVARDVARNGVLFIVLPRPQDAATMHLLQLLVAKLKTGVTTK